MGLFGKLKLFSILFFMVFFISTGFSYAYDGWRVIYSHPVYGSVTIQDFGPYNNAPGWRTTDKGFLSGCTAGESFIRVGFSETTVHCVYWGSAIWNGSPGTFNATPIMGPLGPYGSGVATITMIAPNTQKPETTEQGSNSPDSSIYDGDDVNITNGNMFLKFNDFAMRGRGLSTEIVRTYNSQSQYEGPFGYGWTFDYSEYLKIEASSVTLRDKQGALTTFTLNSDGSFSSPVGERSKLVKNSDNSYTLTTKNGIIYSFTSEGKLASISDRNGNSTLLSYLNDKLDTVTDSAAKSLRLSYNGKISSITDPAGRIISYDYDGNGNLIKVTDPAGGSTQYAYDVNHNMVTVTNANGASIHFTYDDQDRCTDTRQDNNIQAYSFVYHPESSITEMSDGNGHKTTFHYDAEKGVNLSITDAQGGVTAFTWDENLNRTSITAPNGSVTNFTYDQSGNPLTVTNPMGGVSAFTYEPKYNLVTSITNPMSQTTSFDYDNKGNPLSITNALGGLSSFTYDSLGNLISMKAPNGAQTSYEYDAGGYVRGLTNPLGEKSLTSYDTLGNLLTTTDAKGSSTAFSYDILNHLVKVTFPPSTINQQPSTISYTYDAAGNRLSSTDQNGNTTSFAYDTGSRMIRKTDPTGSVTEYTYDSLDNLLSLKDSNGGAYQYYYDALDRVLESVSPIGSRTKFSYDAIGNVVAVKDANGNTIGYDYDLNNKLLNKRYPDGTGVSYNYDSIGNRLSMTDSIGTSNYSYDALNRLTQSSFQPSTANYQPSTIAYSYDSVGNRVSMTDQDGGITCYSYDVLNRLVKLADPSGKETRYSFDSTGNLTSKLYPNSIQTNYSYDNMNRLTQLTAQTEPLWSTFTGKRGGNNRNEFPILSYSYRYNSLGMKTEASFGESNYKYAYDTGNRLVTETLLEKKREVFSNDFSFDPMGNRLSVAHDENNRCAREAVTNSFYNHNTDNSLLQIKSVKGKKTTTADYTYDANGSMLTKTEYSSEKAKRGKLTSYSYDYENRLTKITFQSTNNHQLSTIEYIYDGDGRRISCRTNNYQQSTINYLYDGLNVIIDRNGKGRTIASYTRGLSSGGGIGGIISKTRYFSANRRNANTYYYHYDGSGNVVALTDNRGMIVQRYSYDAYGNLLSKWGNIPNRYRFSTKEFSAKSGLYYFGARYYDPETGRWMQKDPLGMVDGPNMYLYCLNNPVNFVDPWGLAYEYTRPLDNEFLMTTAGLVYGDYAGGSLYHAGFIYEDGTTSGYFDDSRVRSDNQAGSFVINQMVEHGDRLDDKLLKSAEQTVANDWDRDVNPNAKEYGDFTRNCHDYRDAVSKEYKRLLKEKRKGKSAL